MKRLLPLALLLAGCVPAGMAPPGFEGPDPFAGSAAAAAMAIPADAGTFTVAPDRAGARVAYATATGVYVAGPGQGEARLLAAAGGPIGELVWSPDERHLLYTEREVPVACGPTGCVSASADEIYRLRRVALADGAATTLAEHVRELHGLVPAPTGERVAYLRRGPGLGLVDGAGTVTALAPDLTVGRFAWSPDGGRLAGFGPAFFQGEGPRMAFTVDMQGAVTPLGEVPATLSNDPFGPFWTADGRAVRFLDGGNQRGIPVLELPAAGGAPRSFTVALAEAGFLDYRASPDGRALHATRMAGLREPKDTVAIDLDAGTTRDVGGAGMFMRWAGTGPRFLARVGRTAVQRYYVVTPTAGT